MERYKVTLLVESDEDSPSAVLDDVTYRIESAAALDVELDQAAVDAGYAVTVEEYQGGNPCDASAGDQEVDVSVAFDLLHDEMKTARKNIRDLAELASVNLDTLTVGTATMQRTVGAIGGLGGHVDNLRLWATKLIMLQALERELHKQCGDKS
jgi:hypothetical protein